MKTLLILLLTGASLCAQNFAVRLLWMDARHEFNGVAGCPTNWPVAIDNIGTNTVSPWTNRFVMARASIDQIYSQVGPTFTNWYQNTYRTFVANQEAAADTARSNNLATLKALYDDLLLYEQRWQAGSNVTTTSQINTVLRTQTQTLLRLKPILQDLYRGD